MTMRPDAETWLRPVRLLTLTCALGLTPLTGMGCGGGNSSEPSDKAAVTVPESELPIMKQTAEHLKANKRFGVRQPGRR